MAALTYTALYSVAPRTACELGNRAVYQKIRVGKPLYGRFIQSLWSIEKSELESHYGLVKTQFDTWMNRAIEENVVKESKRASFEHPTPQEQEPSGSSDLYGHFKLLQDRLANG